MMDGELYWGTPSEEASFLFVDGYAAAKRLHEHHYTTLSHVHSYFPWDSNKPVPNNKSINS